jgi:membrane protein YqaA with SNARE-associated domain
MCPVCLTNAALIVAGATSSGGLTAFMMSRFYGKKKMKQARGKQNESKREGTRN